MRPEREYRPEYTIKKLTQDFPLVRRVEQDGNSFYQGVDLTRNESGKKVFLYGGTQTDTRPQQENDMATEWEKDGPPPVIGY